MSVAKKDHNNHNHRQDDEAPPIRCFLRISIGGEILTPDVVIELDTKHRPKTCRSFLSLLGCDSHGETTAGNSNSSSSSSSSAGKQERTSKQSPRPTYRGCEFHRVVPGLCVQAGDWERFDGTGGFSPLYGRNWSDEDRAPNNSNSNSNNKHDKEGIVSMANAGRPHTNGSQFFVTLKPTPHLDGKHVVFGRVVSGMESIRKMEDVERGAKDRPVSLQRIVIEECGRLSLSGRSSNSSSSSNNNKTKHKNEEENENGDGRKPKKSRSRSKSRKESKKKKSKTKRDRNRHRRRRERSSSSSSSSRSSSESDDDSRRRRRSRKSQKRKHHRHRHYDSPDSGDNDSGESSVSSSTGSKRYSDAGERGRKRTRDEGKRSTTRDRNEHKKRSQKHERRRSSSR